MKNIICKKCNKSLPESKFYFCKINNRFRKPCIECGRKKSIKKYPEINKIEGEIWKDILGYEGMYQISNKLRVISLKRTLIYKNNKSIQRQQYLRNISLGRSGYFCVSLNKEGKRNEYLLHRLIAIAFIPNPLNLPEVNHKDGNKLNNNIDNLEWCTHKENVIHAFNIGLNKGHFGENHGLSVLTESKVLAIRRLYRINPKFSRNNIAKKLNVKNACIGKIINRKSWKHI